IVVVHPERTRTYGELDHEFRGDGKDRRRAGERDEPGCPDGGHRCGILAAMLVSVIIPVFNRAAMLVEAVTSALAQTHRPIEIVIVDDGSTDDTVRVADELANDSVRVVHQANGGPGAAREAGRRIARGELIQHLDSDDFLLPRKLELQVAALRA